ncbi:class I SAM-dependent methyltransferase [Candidatus Uhrbacteria bacterium]|nr:class I SAM-dependent methyltransferase [Candidatus Uhrbacteria bacterium]
MNPSVVDRYKNQKVAESYDSQRFESFIGRYANSLEIKEIRRLIAIAGRSEPLNLILDLPCGTGRITEFLLNAGIKVVGVDIAEEMLEQARNKLGKYLKNGQLVLELGDARSLKYEDNCFDCVTSVRFFHHFDYQDKLDILKELSRITKRHIILNFAYTSPLYAVLNGTKNLIKRIKGEPIQKKFSAEQEIQSLIKNCGLREKKRRFTFPLLSANVVLLLEKP